jgi:hypothetical protein
MNVRYALDLTSDARLLRAPRNDALEDRNRLVVGRDGGGQVPSDGGRTEFGRLEFGDRIEFDGAPRALQCLL